jgi:hypothetical protein
MSKKISVVLLAIILLLTGLVCPACKGKPTSLTQTQAEQSVSSPPTRTESPATTSQPNKTYLFSNDWLEKGNIYVYGRPPIDYLRTVNATGVTWSVYWIGLNEQEQEYVDDLHDEGFKVGSNFPTVQGNIDLVKGDQGLLERASCRDFNGGISYLSWVPENRIYFMCHNNPEWQEFLKNRIKEHIDGGADAIQIDEIEGTGSHLDGAGFCDYCIKGFRDYLAGHYAAADLLDRFGISDIASFDYRGYLHANNATSVWEDPNHDLLYEYMMFQYTGRLKQINDLIKYARDYAGRDILFSANIYGLSPSLQIYIPSLDFIVSETPIGLLPAGKQFARYFLSEAIDPSIPFTAFPDIFDLEKLSTEDWRLWRHWLAEAYACNASFLLPYQAYTYGGGEYTLPAEKIADYTTFITNHPEYYRDTSALADVAVLFSLESALRDWSAWENFLNLGKRLQEAHVQFRVVFCGDSQLFPAVPDAAELERYQALIIPPGHSFAGEVKTLLEQYAQNGGSILEPATPEDIPTDFSSIAETGIKPLLETSASGNMSITVSRKDDAIIAHIINYNYDYAAHDFMPEKGIEITLNIPASLATGNKTLRLMSPDYPEEVLKYSLDGNSLTFTVPEVHEYSVLVFK